MTNYPAISSNMKRLRFIIYIIMLNGFFIIGGCNEKRVIHDGTILAMIRGISSVQEEHKIENGEYTSNLMVLRLNTCYKGPVIYNEDYSIARIEYAGVFVCCVENKEDYHLIYIPFHKDHLSYYVDSTGWVRREKELADQNSPKVK